MLVTTDIKSITYEIGPQKKVQNYGIYFQNHFRNFCELSGLCRTVYKTTYKKLEYNICKLPTRKKAIFEVPSRTKDNGCFYSLHLD